MNGEPTEKRRVELVFPGDWATVGMLIARYTQAVAPDDAECIHANDQATTRIFNNLSKEGLNLRDPQTARMFRWGAVTALETMIRYMQTGVVPISGVVDAVRTYTAAADRQGK